MTCCIGSGRCLCRVGSVARARINSFWLPKRFRREQCRPERRSVRSINVCERMDEPWRLPAEVMCRVQHEKTWSSGQRGCILRPCQGQNGNPGSRVFANTTNATENRGFCEVGRILGTRFSLKLLIVVRPLLLLTFGYLAYSSGACAQESGSTVTGRAVVRGPDGQSFSVAGATMELTSVSEDTADASRPLQVKTNRSGVFRFKDVDEGCYVVVGQSTELRGQSEVFCVPWPDEPDLITVEMQIEQVVESIQVTASVIGIDPTETSSTASVGVSTLHDAPKANRSFEDVMPLIPGVLRGPSGEINMSGARASQSAIELNGADVTDPVTRTNQINLPIETVSNVQVLTSPYDTQYGGFAGAVSTVETKPANLSNLKISFQNFTPRIRRRDGAIMGIESSTPRFTMTGPIRKGKLGFFHSTEYQFVRADQEDANLPLLERDVEREALSVFTQVDARHSDRNGTSVNMLIYPEKLNFFGLNAFTPQQATTDLRHRGRLATLRNNHEFGSGATLLSQLSYQNLDGDVKPLNSDPARIGLERASGGFFNRQSRSTIRRKWSELYRFAPLDAMGRHQLKTGFQLGAESYHGDQIFRSVQVAGDRGSAGPTTGLHTTRRRARLEERLRTIPPRQVEGRFGPDARSWPEGRSRLHRLPSQSLLPSRVRVRDRKGREDSAAGRRGPLLRPNQSHSAHVPTTSPTHRDAIRTGRADHLRTCVREPRRWAYPQRP